MPIQTQVHPHSLTQTPHQRAASEPYYAPSHIISGHSHLQLLPELRRIIPQVQCQVAARIPSEFGGTHMLHLYSNSHDDKEHMALVFGQHISSASLNAWLPDDSIEARRVRGASAEQNSSSSAQQQQQQLQQLPPPLVRIHSCCFTGETVGSLRCDCAEQLQEAIRIMSREGNGVILYLIQEGRGIGLRDKLMAYNLIDLGHDTLSANIALGHLPDERTYTIASAMLADLGITSIRMLTNNPNKMQELVQDGIQIVERIPMMPSSWKTRHQSESPSVADSQIGGAAVVPNGLASGYATASGTGGAATPR
eukprot:jgi/Hompol1/3490/HPOL_003259-RA